MRGAEGRQLKDHLQFLNLEYTDDSYYWFAWVALRKVLLGTVAVAFPGDLLMQLQAGALLVGGTVAGHSISRPYRVDFMNRIELFALSSSLFLLFSGGVLQSCTDAGSFCGIREKDRAGYLLFCSLILIVVLVVGSLGFAIVNVMCCKKSVLAQTSERATGQEEVEMICM
jgi:hypothetical protein